MLIKKNNVRISVSSNDELIILAKFETYSTTKTIRSSEYALPFTLIKFEFKDLNLIIVKTIFLGVKTFLILINLKFEKLENIHIVMSYGRWRCF